jgi:hypothetical protein
MIQTKTPYEIGQQVEAYVYDMRPETDDILAWRPCTITAIENLGRLFDVQIQTPDGRHRIYRTSKRGSKELRRA